MNFKKIYLILWKITPSCLRGAAKKAKFKLTKRFRNAFYCKSKEELLEFCKELDRREISYLILDLSEYRKRMDLTILTDSDDFSFGSLAKSFSKLQYGRKLFRREFISLTVFHTDGIEGRDIRYERIFGKRILDCREANSDGIYLVAKDMALIVALNDLMFFYFAISPHGNDWGNIPTKGLQEFYSFTLQKYCLDIPRWEESVSILVKERAFPNLDYLLFRSRQSRSLISIANAQLDEYANASSGLAVFCLLSNFDSVANRDKIRDLLLKFQFTDIKFHDLSREQTQIVMFKFRSGRWSVGRATGGGEVRCIISCISTDIKPPTLGEFRIKFPIDDITVQEVKLHIRDVLAGVSSRPKGTQIIHSSDCSKQAKYYLVALGL